ncbi:hypothetical protein LINPERHAP1_LOCUS37745 [Linum perenne]
MGGLVRNSSGYCILAFTVNLGSCSITRAELRGILIGLREGNHAVDFLTNLGHQRPIGIHSILVSDCNLDFHLLYDALGISESRTILSN